MAPIADLGTYNQRFQEVVRRGPERIAIRLKTLAGYRQLTYGELHHQVLGVAQALTARGLHRQERVAILSENRPEWVVAYLGTCLAGGTAVPLDPQISSREWRRLLGDSDARLIFVSRNLLPKLKESLTDSLTDDRIICFDPLDAGHGAHSAFHDLIEWGHSLDPAPSLPESRLSDVVVIIYTSGTTGKPKGVMLTQENIVGDITMVLQAIRVVDENDVFLCLLPLHHVFASVVNFLLPLYLGAQVVFADTLKRSEILAALQEAGITILATVPQFFYLFHGRIKEDLARRGKVAQGLYRGMLGLNRLCLRFLPLNPGKLLFARIHGAFGRRLRLFVSGGSAFDPKVAQEFHDLGFVILQGYGLTETTGACAVTRIESNVIGSVGTALPGTEIRILNPGEVGVGEIAIRGPMVMKGYYRDPEGTSAVMRDGWFLSGDLGRLDDRGNLFITGRKKEVIVLPNGKNIYPDELESHYEQSPYIKEIAVLGIADDAHQGSERLHAVVVPDFDVLKAGKIANTREILRDEIARLSSALPQYKRLMSYQIQKDELPRTTTRKVKRLELKGMIESGELRDQDADVIRKPATPGDHELLESAAGEAVLVCLRDTYRRGASVDLDMNLELDLGFDSMERVELLASLEQALGLKLPEGFGAEIFTVRDLIRGLQRQSGVAGSGIAARQSWTQILSAGSLEKEPELEAGFSGPLATHFRWAAIRVASLLFRVFFRLESRGLDHLPHQGPFLICPNHVSYLDALAVLSPLPRAVLNRVFFVGAANFFSGPVMRQVARVANIFPVDPDVHLLRAMKAGAHGLRRGRVLCIFPEGARSFDGRLGQFKKGAAILAREIGVPMVPVAIQGAHEVWPRGSARIRLHKIRVSFGEPLQARRGEESSAYEQEIEFLRREVERLLARV